MQPDDRQLQPQEPRGQVQPPARDHDTQHEAVANLTRAQIDNIYTKQAAIEQSQDSSPYHQTHNESTHGAVTHDWQEYHSAWQDYYQKYYEHYYVGAIGQAHQALRAHAEQLQAQAAATKPIEDTSMSQDEALYDLRSQLIGNIQKGAKKVRKSRHFVPLISAIIVLLIFSFLQYNSVIFANVQAYISPGNIDPQNIIIDPNASLAVSPDPKLIIPKLNIEIGVDYNTSPDYGSQMAAMAKGVAYFGVPGADSRPGQLGNVPIAGHSSSEFYDEGVAKFIFARLDQLQKGDSFYLNYQGTRYTYSVTGTRIVAPTDVKSLQIGYDKPMVTLITCTPIGTAQSRLLVFAEQVSPSPSLAKAAPNQTNTNTNNIQMTGKSPTLLERAFGAQ